MYINDSLGVLFVHLPLEMGYEINKETFGKIKNIMEQQKKYDIFISYSRKDFDEVNAFVEMLKLRIPTLEVWMDLDGIEASDEFDEKIITAIDASSYVIFAMSNSSNSVGEGSSKWTKKELVYAKNTGKKVIPLLLNGAVFNSWFLFEFGRVDSIDIQKNKQIEKLIKNIAKWTCKELINSPTMNKNSSLSLDEQQFLTEAQALKNKVEANIRRAKIAFIAIIVILLMAIPVTIGVNRCRAYNGIHWQYTILNDSIAPYTIEITGFDFVNNYKSTKLSIPQQIKNNDTTYLVTRIGNNAFYKCHFLKSITIPYGVTNIGKSAFEDCLSLTLIKIPNSVTSIGAWAFSDCESLMSIRIPSSVTSIENAAFRGTGIYNEKSNWEEGVLYINNCLIAADENIMGDYSIKANTRLIAKEAFYSCNCITSITIPNCVTNIATKIFEHCDSLVSIIVATDNPIYDSRENCNAIIETATNTLIAGCKNTIIPKDITNIGVWAFSHNDSLFSITLPDGVINIGKGAFCDCYSLSSITIPDGVTNIGDYAFSSCWSFSSITLPNGVTNIGDYAFSSCWSLSATTLPDGVTNIGEGAFCDCYSLSSITLPDGVTNIGEGAFRGCNSLSSITIPDGVTNIGDYAFSRCYSLSSITLPESITIIGRAAFYDCYPLTAITYMGTKVQWENIEFNEYWNDGSSVHLIHCFDGDVEIL